MNHRKYSYREQNRRDVIALALNIAKGRDYTISPLRNESFKRQVKAHAKLFKALKKGKVLSELEYYMFKKHYAGFLNEITKFIGRKPYEKPKKPKKVTTLSDAVKKKKKKKVKNRR